MLWSDIKEEPNHDAIAVNVASMPALDRELRRHLTAYEGFALATLNLDHVIKLRSEPAFAAAYRQHSHITADGNPIVWLSRVAGDDVALLPGSDLIRPIAKIAAECGAGLALLGSTEDTLSRAAQALKDATPGLKVTCQIAPPMGFDPTGPLAAEYIETLKASGAQLCFVAMGAPKQEIFASFASQHLPEMGFVSIGAGLDFIAGHQTRAPLWVRKIAAEWLWRLLQNPRRMAARYGLCFAVLPGLLIRALKTRLSLRNASSSVS